MVIGVFDLYFMMGLMGLVVGECIIRLIEYVVKYNLLFVIFSVFGGVCM